MEMEIQEATEFISSRIRSMPEIGLITGTGLGGITENMEIDFQVPYDKIPHFPISTVEGHKGRFIIGQTSGRSVLAMEGRFHIYEGYSPEVITFPIRCMSRLGIKYLFISSAAGGLNPLFSPGDIMLVTDHINLTGRNPLIGPNLDEYGPRFPDMSRVYDPDLIDLAKSQALKAGIHLNQGVYVGLTGPSLETPAETRFLRIIGADAVGMSTVAEVIAGVHCGLRIMVIVAITNINLPDCMQETSLEEVIDNANKAGPSLEKLWRKVIRELPN